MIPICTVHILLLSWLYDELQTELKRYDFNPKRGTGLEIELLGVWHMSRSKSFVPWPINLCFNIV